MEDISKYSQYDLAQLPYRILQQVAKSMLLPSNVKKIYLVELIFAKTHRSADELDNVIQKVRQERQIMTHRNNSKRKVKKKIRLQVRDSSSPPIDLTPKRARCREKVHVQSVVRSTSDRVLRSYNLKSYKRPNYSMINNSIVAFMQSEKNDAKEKETQINIINHQRRLPQVNVTARCVVQKLKAHSAGSYFCSENQISSVNTQTQTISSMMSAKRARNLNNIYTMHRSEPTAKSNYECIKEVGFRRTDGQMSKINAVVLQTPPKIQTPKNIKNVEVTIQDIIDCNIDSNSATNPSMSGLHYEGSKQMPLSDVMPNTVLPNSKDLNCFSVYYHKKISEKIRSQKCLPSPPTPRVVSVNGSRPRPAHSYKRITSPRGRLIYVQVAGRHEQMLCSPVPSQRTPERRGVRDRDSACDVTQVIDTHIEEPSTVLTPHSMCSAQQTPNEACDVTTSSLISAIQDSPSLLVENMTEEKELPILSDVYSADVRDVTIASNIPENLQSITLQANKQTLPKFSEVFVNVSRCFPPGYEQSHLDKQTFRDATIADQKQLALRDVKKVYERTKLKDKQDSNDTIHDAANQKNVRTLRDVKKAKPVENQASNDVIQLDHESEQKEIRTLRDVKKPKPKEKQASNDVIQVYEQAKMSRDNTQAKEKETSSNDIEVYEQAKEKENQSPLEVTIDEQQKEASKDLIQVYDQADKEQNMASCDVIQVQQQTDEELVQAVRDVTKVYKHAKQKEIQPSSDVIQVYKQMEEKENQTSRGDKRIYEEAKEKETQALHDVTDEQTEQVEEQDTRDVTQVKLEQRQDSRDVIQVYEQIENESVETKQASCDISQGKEIQNEMNQIYDEVGDIEIDKEDSHDNTEVYDEPKLETEISYDTTQLYEPVEEGKQDLSDVTLVSELEEAERSVGVSVPCNTASGVTPPAAPRAVLSRLADCHTTLTRRVYHTKLDYTVSSEPQLCMEIVCTLRVTSAGTHAHTNTVYSTNTAPTAALLASVPALPALDMPLEPASQYTPPYGATSDEVSRLCDIAFAEPDITLRTYQEADSISNCSVDSGAPTIPEIFQDALEVIDEDGDYSERIEMDVRMQCILCSWAGPKIILENHLREDHSSQILQQEKPEWNVTYKLSNLVNQQQWLSHVCDRDSTLYILSVKYEDPDCFMASLTKLSRLDRTPKYGSITLYNKVTGEPFSWQGLIPQLPQDMPHDNDTNCLKIELSKLELLPNSANLKLINRELVLNSPTKVIVGQPELNDIHIIIFVQIHV